MKAKRFDYFDTKTMTVKYGIKAYCFGKWMPAARNGKALIFDTEGERDQELKAVRKQRKASELDGV